MQITLDEIERKLKALGVRIGRRTTSEIRSQCPVHHGENPTSLSIRARPDGRLTVRCFASNCPAPQIWRTILGAMPERLSTPPVQEEGPDRRLGMRLLTTAIWNTPPIGDRSTLQYLMRRGVQDPERFHLRRSEEVAEFLQKNYTVEELRQAGLMYKKLAGVFHSGRILIPYVQKNVVYSIRSRSCSADSKSAPKYLSLYRYPARLYVPSWDRLGTCQILIIVEGEFKSMVLTAALPEQFGVIALPGVTSCWKELEVVLSQYSCPRRLLIFDGDSEHIVDLGRKLAMRIGAVNVVLPDPGKPDDYILMHGRRSFLHEIRKQVNQFYGAGGGAPAAGDARHPAEQADSGAEGVSGAGRSDQAAAGRAPSFGSTNHRSADDSIVPGELLRGADSQTGVARGASRYRC